jgi:hypothetical protein
MDGCGVTRRHMNDFRKGFEMTGLDMGTPVQAATVGRSAGA